MKSFFEFAAQKFQPVPARPTAITPPQWVTLHCGYLASQPASQQSIYLSIISYIDVLVMIQADRFTLDVVMVGCKVRRTYKLTRNAQHKRQYTQRNRFRFQALGEFVWQRNKTQLTFGAVPPTAYSPHHHLLSRIIWGELPLLQRQLGLLNNYVIIKFG